MLASEVPCQAVMTLPGCMAPLWSNRRVSATAGVSLCSAKAAMMDFCWSVLWSRSTA